MSVDNGAKRSRLLSFFGVLNHQQMRSVLRTKYLLQIASKNRSFLSWNTMQKCLAHNIELNCFSIANSNAVYAGLKHIPPQPTVKSYFKEVMVKFWGKSKKTSRASAKLSV